MGTIFDIKRFALHDGPGIRTTVFFKGCFMQCVCCHNPESQGFDSERLFREDRCRLCGECVTACRGKALFLEESGIVHDPKTCLGCGECTRACFFGAAYRAGFELVPDQVMEEVEKDRVFYEQSGGGVTFSGGEPLAQPDFLAALLQASRERSLHTVLDTSGHAPWEVVEKIYPHVDLFLYDLKLIDDEKHRDFTGVSNAAILKNLDKLSRLERNLVIRFPLIPGFNDDAEHLHELGAFVAALAEPPPVDLLPYHRAGMHKYPRLNRVYSLEETGPPSQALCDNAAEILADYGLDVLVKGAPHASE